MTFGYRFNQKVGHQSCDDVDCPRNLPHSLTHLTFGTEFNQSVDNLPYSLTHLTFGTEFNQCVDNLPCSLTHLTLGHRFNKRIDNLPMSLTSLTLGFLIYQKINNLPPNLQKIRVYIEKMHILDKIPFGCKVETLDERKK